MANLLPTRHFAKLALLIYTVGGVSGALINGIAATVISDSHNSSPLWIVLVEGVALGILAILLPRPRRTRNTEKALEV